MREPLRQLVSAPIAHRGLHGFGRPGGPIENSIGAAAAAIAGGFGIECDIQLSRDGEAMVFHDERLERLTAASGLLAEWDAAALERIALGETPDRIPTLAAFLAFIDGRAPLVIEIKSTGNGDLRLTDRALAVLAGYKGAVALESFDETIVAHCVRQGAPCAVGLVGPSEGGTNPDPALVEACDFLSWSIDHVTAIARLFPDVPRTTWTVRKPDHVIIAAACDAQIVFEGFVPVTNR